MKNNTIKKISKAKKALYLFQLESLENSLENNSIDIDTFSERAREARGALGIGVFIR